MIDTDSDDKTPRRVCMRTAIENVEDCSKGTVTKFRDDLKPRSRSRFSLVKMEICERNSNSSNKSSTVTILSVALGLLAFVLIAGVLLLIYRKTKESRNRRDSTKQDPNPFYRDYYILQRRFKEGDVDGDLGQELQLWEERSVGWGGENWRQQPVLWHRPLKDHPILLLLWLKYTFLTFCPIFYSFFPTLFYYLILFTSPKGRLPHVKANFLRR